MDRPIVYKKGEKPHIKLLCDVHGEVEITVDPKTYPFVVDKVQCPFDVDTDRLIPRKYVSTQGSK